MRIFILLLVLSFVSCKKESYVYKTSFQVGNNTHFTTHFSAFCSPLNEEELKCFTDRETADILQRWGNSISNITITQEDIDGFKPITFSCE